MAEGARLESVYTATYRGFESPPHRHIRDESLYVSTGSFLLYSPLGGDENPRPGFDNWQRQLDRPRACERAAPQGRAKRVNPPPHRHILRRARTQVRAFFSHVAPAGGDENPRPGFDNWRNHLDRTKKTIRMKLSHFTSLGFVKQK